MSMNHDRRSPVSKAFQGEYNSKRLIPSIHCDYLYIPFCPVAVAELSWFDIGDIT